MKPKSSVNRPPTPDVVEREPTFQELVNIKFIETGEKERLMELLRERLVDCGWKDEMKAICSEDASQSNVYSHISVNSSGGSCNHGSVRHSGGPTLHKMLWWRGYVFSHSNVLGGRVAEESHRRRAQKR